ncbi:DNA recombination protein RmuC [Chitinophagaceae bacterium LB-8]|uniref:DNA recombination protein RmuC n=1 Tax=Paraflavisolibacter caeni TaxID=2982496 RepID=A0A9X2XZF1_9BACT|nr:DNA recombination protein RmuC [Paraflavisolibacter caeni]MCU7552060.1 DNA recombination protein RmuC [Paraflavisolibacter caeni]
MLLIAICVLNALTILLVIIFRPRPNNNLFVLSHKLDDMFVRQDKLTANLREDFKINREEAASLAKENRAELNETLRYFQATLTETLRTITQQNRQALEQVNKTLETSFKDFRETFDRNVDAMNQLQREKFAQLEIRQTELVRKTEEKLEKMRETVDEKLQKTLNERLGHSFTMVNDQLEKVQKGLGEMQTLAQDVGGLKRVLGNVKMRGGFGEVQLQMLLENIMAPDQYEENVRTKSGSSDTVEFAIKFPNPDGDRKFVWIPIDAKFPRDAYEHLQNAYDSGDVAAVDWAQKNLEAAIKKMAKDICDKYIDPPNTTGFGIMFLPFEGIYAEVVRKASLLEDVQRQCNVLIAGPTTLWAYLHSLQMGFRTLAIQKRSSEVWTILGAVKKEFENFGGLLQKAQQNIQTGLNQLDDVAGVRTRAIQRKLKGVEALGEKEATILLSDTEDLTPPQSY